jgi:hypothetical protein
MRENRFFVRVDLRALRQRLEGRRVTERDAATASVTNDDAFQWLTTRGFHLGHGGWYANSTTLNRLHRTAIISTERVR